MAIGTTRRAEKCFLKLELKEKDISVVKTNRKAKLNFSPSRIRKIARRSPRISYRSFPSPSSFFPP